MPLDQATRDRVTAEAKRRGADPSAALAEAERVAPAPKPPVKDESSTDSKPEAHSDPSRPIVDRLLIGFLPFIKVRELRANWLGLDERIPDDEMTCGDYQAKHGGAAPAPAVNDSPAGGA